MALVPSLARLLLDAVAPLRCAGCDQVSREAVCGDCVSRIAVQPLPPAGAVGDGEAFAAFAFAAEIREIVHRGKFQGNRAALLQLARLAVVRLELPRLPPADAIAVVPLGARRRRQRGYNQAEILAAVLAAAAGRPLLGGLIRTRETAPQSSRGEQARQANVAGAFAWRGPELRGAALWLVDDVMTTGATLGAAASVLREAGAHRVDALVIARVP